MWSCTKCGRFFEKAKQSHSCTKVPIGQHFKNKIKAKELYDYLVEQINKRIGKTKLISLPCCVHLFGNYDFLAVLPKMNGLEIRFILDHKIESPRFKQGVPVSLKFYKNCVDINNQQEIDEELINWLKESYHLKD